MRGKSLLPETCGMMVFVGSDLHNDSSGDQKKQTIPDYIQLLVDMPGLLLFKGISTLIFVI